MLFFYFSFLLKKATWSRILILLCDLPHNSRSDCFLALHCSITPCAQIASMLVVTECSDGLLESYLNIFKRPLPHFHLPSFQPILWVLRHVGRPVLSCAWISLPFKIQWE